MVKREQIIFADGIRNIVAKKITTIPKTTKEIVDEVSKDFYKKNSENLTRLEYSRITSIVSKYLYILAVKKEIKYKQEKYGITGRKMWWK